MMRIRVLNSTLLSTMGLIIGLIMIQHQQQQVAEGSPLASLLAPKQVSLGHPVKLLRDPMPWEDEYFDPAYHVWPKGKKQSAKSSGDKSVEGGSGQTNG